jgi:glutathione-regulated potassium-efflux system ancillary protein KefC/glutathione-regulated potassium-efflux system protein KefB
MESLDKYAILLAAAVVAVPIARWLGVSAILGYLAAGLVVGPGVLGLITDVEAIQHFAEFGVVLLLFVIGLELQPTRLWALRRTVFGLGAAQVALVTLLLGLAAFALGQRPAAAFVMGFGLALASTPLVLQTLAERGHLKSHHGRSAFGILLFQDIAVLPVLAALPLLAGAVGTAAGAGEQPSGAASGGAGPWIEVAKLVGVFALLIGGGRLLLRPALRVVARTRTPEAFTAAALLTVVATALLVDLAGLSMALGAFLAGVMLADSEFRHQLEADIEPFKGLLLGLFFMAVGMGANLGLIASAPLTVLALTAGVLALKAGAQAALGALAGHDRASAWQLGLNLATGGEFAFVLFALAARDRLIPREVADLLVLVVTLSMILGPLLLIAWDRGLGRLLAPAPPRAYDAIEPVETPVIIAGFGRYGQIVARVLATRRIPFTALDANQTQVDFVRGFGNKVYYGDASRLDLLRAAGAESAQVLVLAIDDTDASVRTAEVVAQHFPALRIFARARNRQHAFRLIDAGVHHVMRETLLSSLDTSRLVLESLGLARGTSLATVERFREVDEQTLLRQAAVKDDDAKLKATAREAAAQLEQLFAADAEAQRAGSDTSTR